MSTMKKMGGAGLLAVSLFCLWTSAAAGTTNVVKIRESGIRFFFEPTNITISAGDTIKWTNAVPNPHDSTHNPSTGPQLWHSPPLSATNVATNSFFFTFTNAGSYPYFCMIHFLTHPEQTGTVSVVPPNIAPIVSISRPTNGSTFFAPASFTLLATGSDSDGSVAQIEFFRGTTSLGTSTQNPASNNVSALPAGSYAFIAVATDNLGARGTSSVVNVTVSAPPAITLGSVQLSPSGVFQCRISGGAAGQTCITDGSATLSNWIPIATNIFPNTTCPACPFIDFTNDISQFNVRFFRSRVFP